MNNPIGIFDSGVGGLTVLKEIKKLLPDYDYLYFGDNARTPYGTRSFDVVYSFTLECIKKMFGMGCPLIILACNTASAKALRTIQQKDLEKIGPEKRVLGVLRPTTEIIGKHTKSKHIGILGTPGTVNSGSYKIEINKFFPEVTVHQQACPMWVPLIENNEHLGPGADYFVKKYLGSLFEKNKNIDTIVLGCTHYPLLLPKINEFLNNSIQVFSQGEIVAKSLKKYLHRHPEIDNKCSKTGKTTFYTTDTKVDFYEKARMFYDGIDIENIIYTTPHM